MPSKKLDKKKLEMYKKLLIEMRNEIAQDISSLNSEAAGDGDSKDVSGHVQHMADVASDMYDKEFTMGLASNERKKMQLILEALDRIEKGTYGFCLGTGKPITEARLKAIPHAKYCLEHQEELEARGEL